MKGAAVRCGGLLDGAASRRVGEQAGRGESGEEAVADASTRAWDEPRDLEGPREDLGDGVSCIRGATHLPRPSDELRDFSIELVGG